MRQVLKPLIIRTPYERAEVEARSHFLSLMDLVPDHVGDVLVDTHTEIARTLSDFERLGKGNLISYRRLGAVSDELELIIAGMADGVEGAIVKDVTTAAKIGTAGQMNAVVALGGDKAAVQAYFGGVPRDAIAAMYSRTYDDKVIFSSRIWNFERNAQKVITDTVARDIIQGKSAFYMAKDLEPHLNMSTISWKRYKKETEEIARGIRKRRSRISYEAKRLAVTETNHAYHEANLQCANKAPWVRGVKWHLSFAHRVPDICDTWATQDIDGLGAGVYEPMNAPFDHPNGLCYTTNETISDDEMVAMLDRMFAKAA